MRVPALLLIGDADLWSPPAVMRLFARHIPNNELVIVPEAGHPSTGSNRRFSTRRSSISSAGIRSSRGARFGAGVCHSDLACQHARCMFEPVLILRKGGSGHATFRASRLDADSFSSQRYVARPNAARRTDPWLPRAAGKSGGCSQEDCHLQQGGKPIQVARGRSQEIPEPMHGRSVFPGFQAANLAFDVIRRACW